MKIWKKIYHYNLLHHINSSDPIDNIMEKRCIQFIWNLMSSDTILVDRTVEHSLSMSSTTLGENMRYFMFKYGIYMSEWYGPLSVLQRKIQKKHPLSISALVLLFAIYVMLEIVMYISCQTDNEYISIIDILCTE